MNARYLLPLALLGGCVSTSFRSVNGMTPAPIADRAVMADASDLGENAERIGSISAEAKAVRGVDPASLDELTERAAQIAANKGGTHIVLAGTGTTTTTWVTPETSTYSCERTENGRSCTETYEPEREWSQEAPYASYDVYRVPRERWDELPQSAVPAPYVAAHHAPSHPDGWGMTLGGFSGPSIAANSGMNGNVFPTTYHANGADLAGAWVGTSHVHGSTEYAIDLRLGGNSYDGMASSAESRSVHYTGTYFGGALALRAGKRLAWENFALAAGTGIAGAVWSGTAHADAAGGFVQPGANTTADLYAPMWTSLTFKPACSFGVQGLAEYDVDPFDVSASTSSLSLGVIWQPASACD